MTWCFCHFPPFLPRSRPCPAQCGGCWQRLLGGPSCGDRCCHLSRCLWALGGGQCSGLDSRLLPAPRSLPRAPTPPFGPVPAPAGLSPAAHGPTAGVQGPGRKARGREKPGRTLGPRRRHPRLSSARVTVGLAVQERPEQGHCWTSEAGAQVGSSD